VYSDEYIKSVDIKKCLYESFIVNAMSSRVKNFKEKDYMVSSNSMIVIRAIDHYMCKKIVCGEEMDSLLQSYINIIKSLSIDNPFLFYSLPISKIKSDILVKYIPDIDAFYKRLFSESKKIFKLYEKFINDSNSVSNSEFEKLVEYFYYRASNDNHGVRLAMDKFIRYLLNDKRFLNYQELSLIINYFGYIKCIADGLTDTEIIIADIVNYNESLQGISTGKSVVLSKKLLIKSSFQNNKLENMAGDNGNYIEGLAHLHALFHELRHQKQLYECSKFLRTDISYFMASKAIVYLFNKKDYIDNYSFYEIEKDANYYSWVEIENVIKNYFDDKDFHDTLLNIKKYEYSELIEAICSSRKMGRKNILGKYALYQQLDNAFCQKPMYLLERYKQFEVFYNFNGNPKSLCELLLLDDIDDYCEFYFENVIYRCSDKNMTNDNFYNLSLEQKKSVLKMINRIVDYIDLKILMIINYKNNGYSIASIDNNENLLIEENIRYYVKNVVSLVDIFGNIMCSSDKLVEYLDVYNYVNKISKSLLKTYNDTNNKKKLLLINMIKGNKNRYRK